MESTLTFLLIASGISATLLRVAFKYKLMAYWDYYKPQWLGETCFFCMGFWLCMVQAALWQLHSVNLWLFPVCLAAAAYTYILYSYEGH